MSNRTTNVHHRQAPNKEAHCSTKTLPKLGKIVRSLPKLKLTHCNPTLITQVAPNHIFVNPYHILTHANRSVHPQHVQCSSTAHLRTKHLTKSVRAFSLGRCDFGCGDDISTSSLKWRCLLRLTIRRNQTICQAIWISLHRSLLKLLCRHGGRCRSEFCARCLACRGFRDRNRERWSLFLERWVEGIVEVRPEARLCRWLGLIDWVEVVCGMLGRSRC